MNKHMCLFEFNSRFLLYIERVGGSDKFWSNPVVAANNILTILAMVGLLISACNLIYDNVQNEMEQRSFVRGVGAPDGELDLFELYTFFSVISIMGALALRVYVNTASDYPDIINVDLAVPTNDSISAVHQCLEFEFATAKLTWIDKAYLRSVFHLYQINYSENCDF